MNDACKLTVYPNIQLASYFNEETVQKNKHMSAVLKKNLWFLNIIKQMTNVILLFHKDIDDIFDTYKRISFDNGFVCLIFLFI